MEGESVGVRDDWSREQRINYPRGAAALLRAYRLGLDRVIGHKEWATGRKIDPAFWDMNAFRSDVARWLTNTPAEDDMTQAQLDDLKRHIDRQVGFARDQILVELGRDPAGAPSRLDGVALSAIAKARRDDVGAVRDLVAALTRQVGDLSAAVRGGGAVSVDEQRLASTVAELLVTRSRAPLA